MPRSVEPPRSQQWNQQAPTSEELQRQINHWQKEFHQEQDRPTNDRIGFSPQDKEASEYRLKYPGIATAARLDSAGVLPSFREDVFSPDFSEPIPHAPTWAPVFHAESVGGHVPVPPAATDASHHHIRTLTRPQVISLLMAAKRESGLLFEDIAQEMECSEVWITSALLGQQTFSEEEVDKLLRILRVDHKIAKHVKLILLEAPMRGCLNGHIPVDPTIYRFYEILQVYGTTLKALTHEKVGDAIMSAVDLEIGFDKKTKQDGDYVQLTLCGKVESFTKW